MGLGAAVPGSTFCPKCGKRWRSERHSCAPSALKGKAAYDKRYAKTSK